MALTQTARSPLHILVNPQRQAGSVHRPTESVAYGRIAGGAYLSPLLASTVTPPLFGKGRGGSRRREKEGRAECLGQWKEHQGLWK